MIVGERLTLRLESLAFGGSAVGRAADGRVIFVAGGVPGDTVNLRIEEVKKSHARATLVGVVSPGEHRVPAPCPLVGTCGGCQWQEVAAPGQHHAKQTIVERALHRLGAAIAPLVVATSELGYRTRARMHVGEDGAIGFAGRRSNRIVNVSSCLLFHPALEEAMQRARSVLGPLLRAEGEIAGLVGRTGVHLAVTKPRDREQAMLHAKELVAEGHALGVLVDGSAAGAPEIDCGDDGFPPFFAAADGFAQASNEGNRALRKVVASHFPMGKGNVLELHAGDGNFTRDLVSAGRSVTAVEGAARAADRLARNVPEARVVRASVEDDASRRVYAGERFDAVLLDPPRIGAKELLPSLAKLSDRVVYVSCDPMTLARDAAELAKSGLVPKLATPLDLTPQTYHVEIVLLFER